MGSRDYVTGLCVIPAPVNGLSSVALHTIGILHSISFVLTRSAQAASFLLGRLNVRGGLCSRRGFGRRTAIGVITRSVTTKHGTTLISSTNAPNVSSPNFLLIQAYIRTKVRIRALPNTATLVPTLIRDKFPYSQFYFRNFLPRGGNQTGRLRSLTTRRHAVVFCRSPCHIIGYLRRFTRIFKPRHEISISHRLAGGFRRAIHNAITRILRRFHAASPGKRFIVILTKGPGPGQRATTSRRRWVGSDTY